VNEKHVEVVVRSQKMERWSTFEGHEHGLLVFSLEDWVSELRTRA
jgi:hypothetical protein